MKKLLILIILLFLIVTPVYARGGGRGGHSSGGGHSSFSSGGRSSFSTTSKSSSKGFSTTPKSQMAPKSAPAPKYSYRSSSGKTVVIEHNYYSPTGYGSWNPMGGNFWMWMYLFNRPQTVVQQAPQGQVNPTPQPAKSGSCDKQWWQFWRAFERC